MAEYFFYGTKNGLTALSSKTAHCNQPVDIRNNGEAFALLGKQVYSLSFSQEGCFFSKYMFVIDTPRSLSSFGFVGVDVFVPSAKKIQNIKELLDALLDDYATSYIKENYMNKKETASLPEDFSFANNLISINKYAESDRLVAESSFASGLANSSYLIYHSSDELKDILNEPYRSEYKDYKKVFLIDSDLKNQGVLDVIKCDNNSDLTGKVDLKNLLYRIVESKTSKCNKNILHRNDNLSVTWEEKYCDSETESGSLSELIAKKLVEIDDVSRVVRVLDKTLNKITKSITVKVVDSNGFALKNASLVYSSKYKNEKKNVSGNVITLVGEDAEHVNDFCLYVEGLPSEYKVDKNGYGLKDPETIIKLDRERKTSVNFTIPEIVFENDSLNRAIAVKVSAKIEDQTFVYDTTCKVDRFKDKIELRKQSGTTFNPEDNDKNGKNKDSKNEKTVDVKWLIVSCLSGALLTIGSFFLADYLDLNIFGSHNGHGISQTKDEGGSQTESEGGSQTESEGESQTESEGGSQTESEGGSQTKDEGGSQTKDEGGSQTKDEGGSQSKDEGGSQTNGNGGTQTENNVSPRSRNETTDNRRPTAKKLSDILGKSVLECRKSDLNKSDVQNNSSAKKLLQLWEIDSDQKWQDFLSDIKQQGDLSEVYQKANSINNVQRLPKEVQGKETKNVLDLLNAMIKLK